MANRNDFPGLLVSDPRDFNTDDSNTLMPLAMAPTQGTTPPIVGLLDYNPDADAQAQAQAVPQPMPQLSMPAATQNNGFTNGFNQLAFNDKPGLPVITFGDSGDTVVLPDPNQPRVEDYGLLKQGLRGATGELNKIRKPPPPPPWALPPYLTPFSFPKG